MHYSALRICLFTVATLLVCHRADIRAQWPQFRGPNGDGVAVGKALPTQWSEGINVVWKVSVTGKGHSSPVIADNQIWITTATTTPLPKAELEKRLAEIKDPNGLEIVGDLTLWALCFDRSTGDLLHEVKLFTPDRPEPIHYTNTYASPTPVIHEDRVLVHFGTYGSAAIDRSDGRVLWRSSELHVDHQNGPGSSPVVCNDLVIIHFDGIDRQFIAALDVSDGKLAWRTDRSGEMDPKGELQKSYCTPAVAQTERGQELVSAAANWVYGYSPIDGSELWKASYGALGFSTVPRPIIAHDMAYVCTSFGRSQLLAVKVGGRGDVTSSHIAWTSDSQIPKKPSLAMVGRRLFVGNDTGILTCLDAITGEQLWRARLGGNHAASPIVSGTLVYFFDQEGKATIVRAGDEYQEVAVNHLDAGCHASPAAVDGALYVRTDSHLYRIEAE